MASRRLGVRITAEDGSVGLGGTAWLKNVEMFGTDGRPALTADRLEVRIAPLSLLPGGHPLIHEASLNAAQARVFVAKDGRTNWDFLLKKPAAKKSSTAVKAKAANPPQPNIRSWTLKNSRSTSPPFRCKTRRNSI